MTFIDIRGVNTHNKGAELMLNAIVDRLGASRRLAMSPNGSTFDERGALGLWQTANLNQAPRASVAVADRIPRKLSETFGIARDRDLSGVLDAAGFAYSDSFGPARAAREGLHAKRWARRGVPHVFLPQAFGPFTKAPQRDASRALLERATLVFARDAESAEHVRSLGLGATVHEAPDFTIGLDIGGVPTQIEGTYGAIVPNEKLLQHGVIDEDAYVAELAGVASAMAARDVRPVVVVHEFNDTRIAERVSAVAGCQVWNGGSARVLKRVLADAHVAVGSRFHALVSALSAGTPAVALGWSHKYGALLKDFGVESWSVKPGAGASELVSSLIDDGEAPTRLLERKAELSVRVENMWAQVEAVL